MSMVQTEKDYQNFIVALHLQRFCPPPPNKKPLLIPHRTRKDFIIFYSISQVGSFPSNMMFLGYDFSKSAEGSHEGTCKYFQAITL